MNDKTWFNIFQDLQLPCVRKARVDGRKNFSRTEGSKNGRNKICRRVTVDYNRAVSQCLIAAESAGNVRAAGGKAAVRNRFVTIDLQRNMIGYGPGLGKESLFDVADQNSGTTEIHLTVNSKNEHRLCTMCGIAGSMRAAGTPHVHPSVVERMLAVLQHRGPDSRGIHAAREIVIGFQRLKILDPALSDQPFVSPDGSIVLVCNGEIYNYRELRREFEADYPFRTQGDVEVLIPLYLKHGPDFVKFLNGQFALALYDAGDSSLFLARDPFGICPMYWTQAGDELLFASEVKALFQHPSVRRKLDPAGLDQVLTFPGLVSPRTMFKDVAAVENGTLLRFRGGRIERRKFWELNFPLEKSRTASPTSTDEWAEELRRLLGQSVRRRLQADREVGVYLSGGLDSSLIASLASLNYSGPLHSFSISFPDETMSEKSFQQAAAQQAGTLHKEILFGNEMLGDALEKAVWHSESALKETYNTCSLALSSLARAHNVPVVLCGEGADELFAGYMGHRFDGTERGAASSLLEQALEQEIQKRIFGDADLFYETDYHAWSESRAALYAGDLRRAFPDFNCLTRPAVDTALIAGRHRTHQRSFLDFQLRLVDHLVADHGDRMAMANSVEARYPFLDLDVVRFAAEVDPALHLENGREKMLLRKAAAGIVPRGIVEREKFGFHSRGSDFLLQTKSGIAQTYLSDEAVKKHGVFDPSLVSSLKREYSSPGFRLHPVFQNDLLLVILTTHILLDAFRCNL